MKIYVTQGHEKGIGLEVFIKSLVTMTQNQISCLKFVGFKRSTQLTLETLNFPFEIKNHSLEIVGLSLDVKWLNEINVSESFSSLSYCMGKLENEQGILLTLPTSKNQFPEGINGHTEFFRHFYQKNNIGMFFSAPSKKMLLLSDHIPLSDVTKTITKDLIYHRIQEALISLKKWGIPITNVLISGFNPHAGEGGLIGDEDERIIDAIKKLKKDFKISFSGPYPGDSFFNSATHYGDLLVFVYHDQGLAPFKATQGFIGSNISLGLPYPRLSPDHGTSFNLFGRNLADYRGCAYTLKEAYAFLKRMSHG